MLPSILRREPPPRPVQTASPPPLTVRSNHSPLLWLFIMVPIFIAVPIVFFTVQVADPSSPVTASSSPVAAVNLSVNYAEAPLEPEPEAKSDPKHTKATKRRGKRKHSRKRSKDEALKTPAAFAAASDAPELSKAVAKKVLRSVHMLHCGGEGNLVVNVKITASGQVSSVGSKDKDEVASCVADTVKSLRFPASDKGLTTSHRYRW